MKRRTSRFHELDELILHLKGLVLVRELRVRAFAGGDELAVYDLEIEDVRNRLANLLRDGGGVERRAA